MSYILNNIKFTPFEGVNKLIVTSKFGERTFYNNVTKKNVTSYHKGIDVIGGNNVVAISDGTVIDVRDGISGYSEKNASGNFVIIEHSNKIKSQYCHMKNGSIKVNVGTKIKKGDIIGVIGSTGYATGVHLHLGIKENNNWVNPEDYIIGNKIIDTFENEKEEMDYFYYEIQKGDTLSSIAQKYNCSINTLASINHIINKNLIYAGEKMKIPKNTNSHDGSKTYVVKKGDTLSSIAQKYNTTWKNIYNKNKNIIGNNPNLIVPGQVLVII